MTLQPQERSDFLSDFSDLKRGSGQLGKLRSRSSRCSASMLEVEFSLEVDDSPEESDEGGSDGGPSPRGLCSCFEGRLFVVAFLEVHEGRLHWIGRANLDFFHDSSGTYPSLTTST